MSNFNLKVFQKGFNYSQDGPGNRLVYHLQGCNMRCPWCANPESIDKAGSLMIDTKYLMDSLCPYGAIKSKTINRNICKNCISRECILEKNRNKAIRMSCVTLNIDDMVNLAVSCKDSFYDGGGVTFTGGEPTLQFEGLWNILKKMKSNNINTAVETNGTSKRLRKLFSSIDHLIIDYKIPFSNRHKTILKSTDDQIKSNLLLASEKHDNLLVRIPLIHNINDRDEDLDAFIDFFKTLNYKNIRFELLKYHDYGKNKWTQIGKKYKMKSNSHISQEKYKQFVMTFQKEGLEVVFT